jgi:hypothetical protein
MPVVTFDELIYKGRNLLGCRIKRNMNGSQILNEISEVICQIEKAINLDKVKITDLGLDTCDKTGKNLLTRILNALIQNDIDLFEEIRLIKKHLDDIDQFFDTDTDILVKVNKDDPAAGYLEDKIFTYQKGNIQTSADKTRIEFMGFVPIGTVIMVDAARVGDLDNAGKGKTDTDLWGWALSNGQNGTRNRLGKFPRFITALGDAGSQGGSANFVVQKANMGSFSLPVTGNIADALPADIEGSLKMDTNNIHDGIGGAVPLVRHGTGLTGAHEMKFKFNVKHTHTFSLNAALVNATPTPISLLPEYIYEIPLQRIL